MNFTITVPDGSSNHGNPNLLCTPPKWFDYLVFYATNYFAHAATVITTPGQGRSETINVMFSALLLPGSGVTRAARAILRCSRAEPDPLKRAVRAGALCMVVRTSGGTRRDQIRIAEFPHSVSWRALLSIWVTDHRSLEEGDAAALPSKGGQRDPKNNPAEPKGTDQPSEAEIVPAGTTTFILGREAEEPRNRRVRARAVSGETTLHKLMTPGRPWWDPDHPDLLPHDAVIHGQYHLPAGYGLALVPLEAVDELESPDQATDKFLASSYSFPKILVSFMQAIWAAITLYRSRGDQIEQFGYAAFGLTVAPYAFMSVMNIIGSFLNPDYPAIFLVRTPLMAQAESESLGSDRAFFAAELLFKAAERLESRDHPQVDMYEVHFWRVQLISACIPLAIVGGLSRFQPQDSSTLQRGFTMSWVVLGFVASGIVNGIIAEVRGSRRSNRLTLCFPIFASVIYGVAAIGGMVAVGQMIHDFGICTLLT